jgi:hypothetical protein
LQWREHFTLKLEVLAHMLTLFETPKLIVQGVVFSVEAMVADQGGVLAEEFLESLSEKE